MGYWKWALIFTLLVSAFRLLLAFSLELGNDETYYWLYSQKLQWNYFDHPPMVAIWIRLFTANLALEEFEGFLRLGSVVGCALSGWFLFKTGTLLHSSRAGWFSLLLYHSSFYAGYTAGLYILPDSPQMVFWTMGIWMIARISKKVDSWINWIIFGLAAGLCIMSKAHGIFLWAGLGGYMIFINRSWLRRPQPYLAILLTVAIVSPVLFWNLNNDFATFHSHGSRIAIQGLSLNMESFLWQLFSQLFFNNPVNVVLIILALRSWKKKMMVRQEALVINNFIGLSLPLCILVISFFMKITMPHWSGPGYISLIPLAAIWLASNTSGFFPVVLRWAQGIVIVVYLVWVALVQFYPGTYGSKEDSKLGRYDITLDMYGWKDAGRQFALMYHEDVKKGLMPEGTPLVTTYWWGAHLDYYFSRPLHLPMLGLGRPDQVGQFIWTNEWRWKKVAGANAYCILSSEDYYRIPAEYFSQYELAGRITVDRSGKPAHYFFVYRMKGWKKPVPVPGKAG